jgi:putative endonuclease
VERIAYVYFMTNASNSVLYTGVTTDLVRRVSEHKLATSGFTAKYRCRKLVYFEAGEHIRDALDREKRLKKWHRSWKNALVDRQNPHWIDLGPSIGVTPELVDQMRRGSSSPA